MLCYDNTPLVFSTYLCDKACFGKNSTLISIFIVSEFALVMNACSKFENC